MRDAQSPTSEQLVKAIKKLEGALKHTRALEAHDQLMVLILDELDDCHTFEHLRKFIRELLPEIYPKPQRKAQ